MVAVFLLSVFPAAAWLGQNGLPDWIPRPNLSSMPVWQGSLLTVLGSVAFFAFLVLLGRFLASATGIGRESEPSELR